MINLNWLAGFVDGEAWIGLGSHGTARVSIYQAGIEGKMLLDNLQRELGYGHVYTRTRPNPNWKTENVLQINSKEAIQLLKQLLPSLRRKQDRALWVLRNSK